MAIRFLVTAAVAASGIIIGSVGWPRFTDVARPAVVQKAYDMTKDTAMGKKTAEVLGVSDTQGVQPINVGQVASGLVDQATTAVEKKVQTIIVSQAVMQLMRQIESLDAPQQNEIRSLICSTSSGEQVK